MFLHRGRTTLCQLFLCTLLDPNSIQECKEFGFTGVPESVRAVTLLGINSLDASRDAE